MSTLQLLRRSWWSALALLLTIFLYLYTAAVSLPVPRAAKSKEALFSGDFLTPYPEGRHGSRRTTRDIKECQHVTWDNRTYEEFKLDLTPLDSTDLGYEVHRFADTIKRDYFRHKYIIGSISFVQNPYYTFSVLEPRNKGGCKKEYFYATRSPVSETVSLRSHGCRLAANGGYFSMSNGQCFGNIVSDGRIVQTANDEQNANFGIRQDGTIIVGYIPDEEIVNTTNPFRQLITGVIWLVRNGTNYVNESMTLECASHEDTGNMETFAGVVSARTALGHDDQGRLVMAQVEGQTHRRGTNLHDFADLLIRHGVVNAINLDGGGSATLVRENVLVNYPSDHCSGHPEYRCERAVSTTLCVHDVECLEPDCNGHGSCDLGQCSCDEPWIGESCERLNCSETDCFDHGNCSEGECTCSAGWTGELCNTSCPENHYGPNCEHYCYCFGSSHCDMVTGKCVCPPGYKGYYCWQECEHGTYGLECANICDYPDCSGHGKCSSVNGTCECEEGWSGVACNDSVVPASGSGAIDEEDLLSPNETSPPQPTSTLTPTHTGSTPRQTATTTTAAAVVVAGASTTTSSHSQWPSSSVSLGNSSSPQGTPTSGTQVTTVQQSATVANAVDTQSTNCSNGLKVNATNSSHLCPNDTCVSDHHEMRNTILLGSLLAVLTLFGHCLCCLCTRRSKHFSSSRDYSRSRRTRPPLKRRRLRRKKKPAFMPVRQESSTDCSI